MGCTRPGRFLSTTEEWDWPKSHTVRNALTMYEQNEVIKSQGRHFCEDPLKCAKSDALLERSSPDFHDTI